MDCMQSPFTSPSPKRSNNRPAAMEQVLLDKDILSVPEDLCENENLFMEVFSMETWNEFNSSQLQRLTSLLPTFPENDKSEKEKTLHRLFSGESFKFGNPLNTFFGKLKNGFLSPDIADMSKYMKKAIKKHHSHQQQLYFCRLLKDILSSRKKLLDASTHLSPNEHPKMDHLNHKRNIAVEERTRWRYFSELQEVREEAGELETSSDDENYPEGPPPKISRKHKKLLHNMETALGPEMTRIYSTTGNSSFPTHSGATPVTPSLSLAVFEMTEDKYHNMLHDHQQRTFNDKNHPEMNVANITLDDVIARTAVAKRASRDAKKKSKSSDEKRLKNSTVTIKKEPGIEVPQTNSTHVVNCQSQDESLVIATGHQAALSNLGDGEANLEDVDVDVGSDVEPPRTSTPGQVPSQVYYPTCFFSLLRDLFYELPDQKMSVARLEERVRNWMENASPIHQEWLNVHDNWVELVASSLKFLAGDLIAILPDNFVPYLDYREKQQQWQWIGAGRDSEDHLIPLCQHWMENKDDVSLDMLESSQGSPPPPRVSTDWTVRTTTDEEKKTYREQECIRYQNPHKAFTFHIHGYESVVGPVKGVYGKESGINKAREHSLLVSDRPPFVTILSLVRDSAARLPNGEGTRADICELLKDSQYLAPASDQQIHTVVSGALDRLHYEKDPCVKYDVNRKLWIYLHRHRTEEEFEKIHQAQAAAAKAKKAIQKSKPPRTKSKETVRPASTTSLMEPSNFSLESGALTVAIPHSPRNSANSRAQTSPKQVQISTSRQLSRSLSLPVQTNSKTICSQVVLGSRQRETVTVQTTTVASTQTAPSPKLSISTFSSFLPQNGDNSRPPSHGSVHSLPSPKAVIANVNAAHFMGVSQLQSASLDVGLPSPSSTPTPPPLTIDMKPSSPTFVGQPPVLQPVISGAGTLSSSLMSIPASKISGIAGAKRTTSQSIHSATALQGFQTIVIKQETKSTASLTSLPLIATGAAIGTSARTSTVGSKPIMARLVSGTQVVSLGNLMASAASVKQGNPLAGAAIRIQGGGYVQPGTSLNVLQASQLAAGARLPKLAVVSQPNAQAGGSTTTQTKLITVDQSQLSMLQAAHLEGTVHTDPASFATSKSAAIFSQHAAMKLVASGNPASSQLSNKSTIPVTSVATTSSAISSMILAGATSTSTSAVVIATQGALKSNPHTYVMAGHPGSTPTVVMATTQHGVRGTAVTPLNMKTLQGIKVIPMSQTVGSGRGSKVQPLLARIIAPPSISLRPATISNLDHIHQVATSVQSLRPLATHQATKSPSHPLSTSSGQPVIVQVHTPTLSDIEQSREPQ